MNCKLTLVVLAAAVAAGNCLNMNLIKRRSLASNDRTGLGVYGGKNTTIEHFPYLVAVQAYNETWCMGTILNEWYVMTNADCVSFFGTDHLNIVSGSNNGSTGTVHGVASVASHPDYDFGSFDYNCALIKVKDPFKWSNNTQPAKLPDSEVKPHTWMSIAGWENTIETNKTESNYTLTEGKMAWLGRKACEKHYPDWGIDWTERMDCVYNKGKTTVCPGEWGTPMVVNGMAHGGVVAVAEAGFCSDEAYPVIVFVTYSMIDWINEIIAQ